MGCGPNRGETVLLIGRLIAWLAAWCAARAPWQRMGLAALAGAVTVLALPPFGLWPLLLLTYPAFAWLLDGIQPDAVRRFAGWRATGATGWAFGFGFFLTGLHWIGSAFLVDAETFAWMLPFVAVLLPGGLALFFAGAAIAGRALARRGVARVVALVLALAVSEWLRGHVLTGFPWNTLGYGLAVSDAMVQAAAVWGLYGHTLVAIVLAVAPAALAGPGITPRPARGLAVAIVVAGLPAALFAFGHWRLAQPVPADVAGVNLRIVQPNTAQKDKWRPDLRAANFARLLQLSRGEDGLTGISHVIWPESAPPFLLAETPQALALIADTLPRGTHLITGSVRADAAGRPRAAGTAGASVRFFNAVMVLDDTAQITAVYDKAHLVPFGEYLPAQALLEAVGLTQLTGLRGGYVAGPGPRSLAVANAPPMGPLICYEVIFPGMVVGETRPGWLLNATNDAWFGDSIGPRQHLYQARMRAVEEGLPVIRAANTGISAVIGPYGRIRAHLDLGIAGILDANLPGEIPRTIYSKVGDAIFWVSIFSLLVGVTSIRKWKTQRTL